MKKHSRKCALLLSVIFAFSLVFAGCSSINNDQASTLSAKDIKKLPVYPMRASFVYNTDDLRETAGICDYVFIGEVVSCDGTQYHNVITMEDENGNPKETGSPYTNYTVNVIENLKGELITDQPIKITKQGGVTATLDSVFLFENDELPETNNTYIFFAYAEADGSLLVSGPNTNIPYNTTNTYSEKSTSEYQEYKSAVANEIIPVERERFTSIYEVNP